MSLRNRLLPRPPFLARVKDDHPLVLFHHCDQEVTKQLNLLNHTILQNPDDLGRRNQLMLRLKESQNNLMDVIARIARDNCADARARRDFRMKYPDDVMIHQLNGPLWFGAECLAAGSYIAHREEESEELRPYATHITELIHQIRLALRKQVVSGQFELPQTLKDLISWFDHTWAEFEFRYVSIMCPVLSAEEFDQLQDITVQFIEATQRAIKKNYITEDMMDMMDPSLMFAIPRLAIVWDLAARANSVLGGSKSAKDYPYCFQPYRTALDMLKKKLRLLSLKELETLESALCASEGFGSVVSDGKTIAPTRKRHDSISSITITSSRCSSSVDFPQVPSDSLLIPGEEQSQEHPQPCKNPLSTTQPTSHSGGGGGGGPDVSSATEDPREESGEQSELQGLFLGICGIADKMQSKYSKEMRMVLKHVFYACQSIDDASDTDSGSCTENKAETDTQPRVAYRGPVQDPPAWVSDRERRECHCCLEQFSLFKRRHHCRNCGEVVCNKCSPYTMPLPKYGINGQVRVCSTCYIAYVNKLLHPEATHDHV